MIAATNALKPPTAGAGGPVPSMMSRLRTNKVFAKVTSAFHSRSSAKEKEVAGESRNPTADGKKDVAARPLDASKPLAIPGSEQNKSPITAIRLRLNEGQNLSRKKVQKMTGGQIHRKPVADDGRSLKSCKSFEDPFSEPSTVTRTPTPFECRLLGSSRKKSYVPPLPISNPFVSEKVLESNLEDMLPSPPLASSTPRAGRRHVRSISDSPTKKAGKAFADIRGSQSGNLLSTGRLGNWPVEGAVKTAAQDEVVMRQSIRQHVRRSDHLRVPGQALAIFT